MTRSMRLGRQIGGLLFSVIGTGFVTMVAIDAFGVKNGLAIGIAIQLIRSPFKESP